MISALALVAGATEPWVLLSLDLDIIITGLDAIIVKRIGEYPR